MATSGNALFSSPLEGEDGNASALPGGGCGGTIPPTRLKPSASIFPPPHGGRDWSFKWHPHAPAVCGAIRPKRKSQSGSISAINSSTDSAFAANSRLGRTSWISFARKQASSSKSTADNIHQSATTSGHVGLKNAVIASCGSGTTTSLEIPKGFGRRSPSYCESTPHPNPPPQGGRGKSDLACLGSEFSLAPVTAFAIFSSPPQGGREINAWSSGGAHA